MTNQNRHKATVPALSTAGLLSSLSHALPNPAGPLGRSARALAARLSTGKAVGADHDAAAALLARLLDATDTDLSGYEADGLLDTEFDA